MPRPASSVAAALTIAAGLALAAVAPAAANIVDAPYEDWADAAQFRMAPIGTYETGIFDEGASEIVAYHAASHRLFVVNADAGIVEALDVADPTSPVKIFEMDTSSVDGDGVANSVAIRPDGLGAIALETDPKTDNGTVVFFDANGTGTILGSVEVGPLPDMLTFSPNGQTLLVANEAEPADDYSSDPDGSVSVIAVPATLTAPVQADVATAGFTAFDAAPPAGVRIFGAAATTTLSQSVEPEYITVSPDSATAYVTLQEANAVAILDIATRTITDVVPLGFKDWSASALDPSNNDAIGIDGYPVLGMYQPDAIGNVGGYLVTANEGDVREWGDYSEQTSIEDVELCDAAAQALNNDDGFGPLKITSTLGYDAVEDCYTQAYAFGGRSFSVWNAEGALVWDSGDAFEQLTARVIPEFFNSNNSGSNFDNRSDDKGPEPEGLAVGEVDGVPYVFIGFERIGGIAVYSMSNPTAPAYVGYINNRDFAFDPEDDIAQAGDNGPEGLAFISAGASPTGAPLLAVGNEVSGSTTLYSIVTPEPEEVLATTGADAAPAFWAAGAVLVLGGMVLLVARRRATR